LNVSFSVHLCSVDYLDIITDSGQGVKLLEDNNH